MDWDAVASCDGVVVSVVVCVGDLDGTCEAVVEVEGVSAAEAVPLWEGDATDEPVALELSVVLIVAVEDGVFEEELVGLDVGVRDSVRDGDGVTVLLELETADTVCVTLAVTVLLGDSCWEGDRLELCVAVGVAVQLSVCVREAVPLPLGVLALLLVCVTVLVRETEAVGEELGLCVAAGDGVAVPVPVAAGLGVGVKLCVGVDVIVR
jgi:hypothetical protein